METLIVQVKNEKELQLLKSLLDRFKTVVSWGVSNNERLNSFIEQLEDEEDIKAANEVEMLNEPTIPFNDVVAQWKKEGKI